MTVGLLVTPEKTPMFYEKRSLDIPLADILTNKKKRTPMKACSPKIKLLVIPIPLHLDILFPESFFKGSGLEP